VPFGKPHPSPPNETRQEDNRPRTIQGESTLSSSGVDAGAGHEQSPLLDAHAGNNNNLVCGLSCSVLLRMAYRAASSFWLGRTTARQFDMPFFGCECP